MSAKTAERLVAQARKYDAICDRRTDWQIRSDPERFKKMQAVKAAGRLAESQRDLYGPFLPNVAPAWPVPAGHESQTLVTESGRICRRGDADESAGMIGPVQLTPDFRFAARIEAEFRKTCREETGQTEKPEETARRIAKEARLRRQGHIVADALESIGKSGYRETNWKIWAVDVHEMTADEVPAFRRICLNPWIAYRLRRPFLNWLEYWMQDHHHCRFWTLTSGKRCKSVDLEGRIVELHRKISRLNAQAFMKSAGVEIIFRSTEFGKVETSDRKRLMADEEEIGGDVESGADGHWYHPHAHCVVWMKKGRLPRWQWKGLLESVWAFWRHEWDEGKRIRDVRECVKYCVKPGDMVRLAKTDPEELGRLQEIVFRKKLVQPMGELARQMRAADKAGLRPEIRWLNDERKWTLLRDPNRALVSDGSEDSGITDFLGEKLTNSAAVKALKFSNRGFIFPDMPAPIICNVIARCVPAYNHKGVKSPRVIVMGTHLDLDTVRAHPLVKRIRRATAADYAAGLAIAAAERLTFPFCEVGPGAGTQKSGRAAGISLDTGTPTDRGGMIERRNFGPGDDPAALDQLELVESR